MTNHDNSNKNAKNYRLLIFGAGAIGTYLGGSLCLDGHDVVFLEREKDLPTLKKQGLRISFNDGTLHIPNPQLISNLDEIRSKKFDAAFYALKTYHLDEILRDLERLKDFLPPIICLQNGVGSEKKISAVLGDDLVIPGTITTSVDRNQKGDVIVRRLRGLALDGSHPLSHQLHPILYKAGLHPHLCSLPESMKWSKLLINILGNATSAILDLSPSQIYADPALYSLEINQLRETLGVMKRLNIKTINLPGVPVQLLAYAIRFLPNLLTQPLLVKAIGGGRGGKMPSFHIDLYSGRGKSEVDYLNGAIVRAGQALDFPTPVNKMLLDVLLSLINEEEKVEKYAGEPSALLQRLTDYM